jgi:CheY-like chemotaxis protein/HPt (histidine-containing phosphotransfer) domain-containing protein
VVEQVLNLAAVWKQVSTPLSGPWVWLIDAGNIPPMPDELRAISRFQPEQDVRLVVIGRGKRRRPRPKDADQMVVLDGNVLTRQAVLQAVAIAAGRAHAEMDTPPSGKGEASFIAPSRADALRQGRLILVAEDNDTNQKVILQQLALLGFAADVASDGREALERWRSGDYGLLLTDLHMPKMDGYELAVAIRAEENGARHIVIIALTANALKGEAQRCRDIGMDDYLSKPAPLADLKAVLDKWLPDAAPAPQPADAANLSDVSIKSAAQGTASKPVDVSVLAALVGDNPEVISEFLQDFRSSATQIAAELKIASAAGQAAQVGALAHKLKSSARSVGALALGELCAEIEQAGKVDQFEVLAALLPRFETEMAAVDEYLDAL